MQKQDQAEPETAQADQVAINELENKPAHAPVRRRFGVEQAVRMAQPFFTDPDIAVRMAKARTTSARLALVAQLRTSAALQLLNVAARIPMASDRILAEYRKRGMSPVWRLDADAASLYHDDEAVSFCGLVEKYDPTETEQQAVKLLRACILAQEYGDVPIFDALNQAVKQSSANAANREKKGKLTEAEKRRIIRTYRDAQKCGSTYNVTQGLSRQYGVSRTTIHNVINNEK
ncbi:hypothetical protein [Massilia litorea]|uniref:Uncharacterized protein n=1 Tax=Massilia litorea TaxID=2769491 RepID=A0A7L9U3Z6_9BURK|nr:hypothetical protein [Massilia litorea]QOL49734.1 hypothetical protein LPB04_23155 [Massilia litorea]